MDESAAELAIKACGVKFFQPVKACEVVHCELQCGSIVVVVPQLQRLRVAQERHPRQFSFGDLLTLHTLQNLTVDSRAQSDTLEDGGEDGGPEAPILKAGRALATLPFLRPSLKAFDIYVDRHRNKWAQAFDASLQAVCVPGSGVAVVKRKQHVETRNGCEVKAIQYELVR